jgi:hypothetical protein
VVEAGRIAFDCAKEQAADHLLHAVEVFDEAGNKLKEIGHCRSPQWAQKNLLKCEAESVDSNGKLTLKSKQVELP